MKFKIRENRHFDVVIVDEVDNMLFDDRSTSTQLSSITPAVHHLDILWDTFGLKLKKLLSI
jgi:late competence protein required for DNA uptake (superfamily II DNA/RNA helicase)